MNENRITLVTLAVKDVAKARAFYEAIGWTCEDAPDLAAFFDMGGQKFGLYQIDALAKDLGRDVASLGTGAMTLARNYPNEAEVDAAYAAALAAGGVACKPPEKVFWGGYSGTWADPDGHVWEYAFNPFWTLDAEGRIA